MAVHNVGNVILDYPEGGRTNLVITPIHRAITDRFILGVDMSPTYDSRCLKVVFEVVLDEKRMTSPLPHGWC